MPDWSHNSHSLAMHLIGGKLDTDLYLMANAYWEPLQFQLQPPSEGKRWYRFVDTFLKTPNDISEEGFERLLGDQYRYKMGPRSLAVLIGK